MELFYRHYGSGQPLIILHGLLGISDNWVTIGKRLAEKYSVYIPDQRNHGQSPHSATFDYPSLVLDLAGFVDSHDLRKPILIGHSMGGKVAMQFVQDHPDVVDRLIVVDISPRRYPPRAIHQMMLSAMLSIDFSIVKRRQDVAELLGRYVPDKRIQLFILKNLYRPLPDVLAWRPNVHTISEQLDQVFDDVPCMKTFVGEALFVRGGKSDYIIDTDIPLIRSCFPQAQIATIVGATHWVHADKPRELCAVFSKFLGRHCEFMPDATGEGD